MNVLLRSAGVWVALAAVATALHAAPFAYITNCDSDTVSVIDAAIERVVATVPVGNCPYGVAVSHNGAYAYVTNRDSASLSVIESSTPRVIATIATGLLPSGIAIDPTGRRLYVANTGSDSISIVDAFTLAGTASIPVAPYARRPAGIVVHPDGSRLYVTAQEPAPSTDGLVLVVDVSTRSVTSVIRVNSPQAGIAIDRAGARLYVPGASGGVVVDTATDRIAGSLLPTVDAPTASVAIHPTGSPVYVAANYPGSPTGVVDAILAVDPATGIVTGAVPIDRPAGIGINAAGTRLYVASGPNSTVVVNTATNAIRATIRVGSNPIALGQFFGSEPGLVAVEFLHREYGHYFVTTSETEIARLDAGVTPGWERTRETFKVSTLGTPAAKAVCRFWSGLTFVTKSSHFYTPVASECARVKTNPDWIFEGEVFAMYEPGADGRCASDLMPLYRLYNQGSTGAPNHRYTTSLVTRDDMVAQGWIPEGTSPLGVIGCVTSADR